MGVSINFTKGSGKAHLSKRLSKQQLAERQEKQQLAQHKIEEAVRRAQRSNAGVPLSPTRRTLPSFSTTTTNTSKQWAFSHARREGDRRMGGAVTYRPSTTTAYAPVNAETLEKKRNLLLATPDWSGLSRSNSPRSRSETILEAENEVFRTPKVKIESYSTAGNRKKPDMPKGPHTPKVKVDTKIQMDVKTPKVEEEGSSLTDIYMSSSPPKREVTLSSSIQSTFSSSSSQVKTSSSIDNTAMPNGRHETTPVNVKLEHDDEKPSSQALTDIMSSQASVATYATSPAKSDKVKEEDTLVGAMRQEGDEKPSLQELNGIVSSQASIATYTTSPAKSLMEEGIDLKPILEDIKPNPITAGLQYLGPPFSSMRHIRELDTSPLLLNYYLPCMLGDCNPPFVYDGITRCSDFLGMAFAGPDMDF